MAERTTFEELMTVGEVAETLRYSEGTVRHWIRTGKLPAIQVTGGREYRIRLPDFLAFAEGLGIPVRPAGPGRSKGRDGRPARRHTLRYGPALPRQRAVMHPCHRSAFGRPSYVLSPAPGGARWSAPSRRRSHTRGS